MAMLAEPRRRQRIGPNPRGKFFLEDGDNKGRTMLEKLGWNSGEGLGRQNQGMSNPLCPKIQMDAKGLGYDIKNDPWIAHSEDFTQVLQSLQAINTTVVPVVHLPDSSSSDEELQEKKLEKMSKSSRARIHYHKFVKSKDVSNFSKTNLKSIFGKEGDKSSKKSSKKTGGSIKETIVPDLRNQVHEVCVKDDSFNEDGVKTINRGSMADYFSALFAQKRNGVKVPDSIELIPNNNSNGNQYEEVDEQQEIKQEEPESCEVIESTTKKGKKREKVKDETEFIPSDTIVEKEKKKRKKRKLQDNDDDTTPLLVDSPSPVLSEENISKKEKKSKKKKHIQTEEDDSNTQLIVESLPMNDSSEIPVKKEKKKRKKKKEIDQDGLMQTQDHVSDESLETPETESLPPEQSAGQGSPPTTINKKKTKLTQKEILKIAEQFPGANIHQIYGYGPY